MGRRRGRGLTAISLFSGAGGLDIGLAQSGWEIPVQVEMDADCAATLKELADREGVTRRILCSRLEDVAPRSLRLSMGLAKGELDLIAGGPPCQPFTTTGLRKGLEDRRASSAFPGYLQYVSEFLPRAILMENVDGMLSAALSHRPLLRRGKGFPPMAWEELKGSFLHWLLTELAGLGYAVSWGVLEAADYGVPQFRQRAVLIGVRGKEPCHAPQPTHGKRSLPQHRTLRDALRGVRTPGPIQPLSARKIAIFSLVPPGGNWRNLPDHVRRQTMGAAYLAEGGKSGWWRRPSWDEPCPTILGMPDHSSTGLIHPDEVRCLSMYECAAVQTFPPGMTFVGSPRSGYRQVGNAVPPVFARALGGKVRRFLEGRAENRPVDPVWRQASANRRIGTHGWVVPAANLPQFEILTDPRPDSVWAGVVDELCRA